MGDDSDSGAPIEPIHGPGLTMHGVQVCAQPELRASLGPLEQPDVGEVWAKQAFEPMEPYPYGPGVTVADLEGDGVPEVLLSNLDVQLFRTDPKGWVEIGAERFPKHGDLYARAVAPADYDGDGDLDLFIVNATTDLLWQNDGTGHFVDVSKESGLSAGTAGQSAVWADADGDGDLDLFVSNRMLAEGPRPPDLAFPNVFYENLGDGTFRDRTELFSEDVVYGYTFVTGFDDLDDDRDPDLYIVNDYGGMVYGNRYLRNDSTVGSLAFTDVTTGSGLELDVNGMGLGVGDLDGDPIPDLVITDWGHIHLMDSEGGVWFDTAESQGLRPNLGEDRWLSWGVELVDLDNDGRADIPIVFGPNGDGGLTIKKGVNPPDEPDDLFVQQEDGSFVAVGDEWGFAEKADGRGLVVADIDGDGWLDLIEKSFDEPAHYFHARCGSEAWLQVDLVGKPPNTAGIGARVTVEAGGRTWQQWIRAGGTSMSSSGPPIAHFGLGDLDSIDRITVTWRDGATSLYQVIDTRQRLTIEEL